MCALVPGVQTCALSICKKRFVDSVVQNVGPQADGRSVLKDRDFRKIISVFSGQFILTIPGADFDGMVFLVYCKGNRLLRQGLKRVDQDPGRDCNFAAITSFHLQISAHGSLKVGCRDPQGSVMYFKKKILKNGQYGARK